ncbi:phosphatase PAP2 family protein [Fuchsiella alkaliacetigena]|nr:phosphatase PAP2 family protein [Fuchsiella alkaliacetigena]
MTKASPDQKIRDFVQETNRGLWSDSMSVITHLGLGEVNFAIATILPDREARYDSYKALLVSSVSVTILKYGIGKSRPEGEITYEPYTTSASNRAFPSGHTTTAFALATIMAEYYPEYKNRLYALATLVGISRLYVDAHWASDVVAGAGLGYASAKFVEYRW